MSRPRIKFLRQEEKYDPSKRERQQENFYKIEYGKYSFKDVKATELHDCGKCDFLDKCSYENYYDGKRYIIPGDICFGKEVRCINLTVIAIGIISDIFGLMFLYLDSNYLVAFFEFFIITILVSAVGVLAEKCALIQYFINFMGKFKNRQDYSYEVIIKKIKSNIEDTKLQNVYLDSLELVKNIETISHKCSFDKSEDEHMVQIIDLAKKVVCISALRNISIDKISEQILPNLDKCIRFYFNAQQSECLDEDYERILEIALAECLDFLKSENKDLKKDFKSNADFS